MLKLRNGTPHHSPLGGSVVRAAVIIAYAAFHCFSRNPNYPVENLLRHFWNVVEEVILELKRGEGEALDSIVKCLMLRGLKRLGRRSWL
jgi:hypothetical protein